MGGAVAGELEVVFQRLFEACGDGLLVSDAEGRCVSSNPRAHELLALTGEALKGRVVTELLGPAALELEVTRLPLREGQTISFLHALGARPHLSLRQFEFMVERSSEEIYLVRRDGSLAYVNEAAARSLGYSREELLALGLSGIDALQGPGFAEHLQSLLAGPGVPFETTHLTRDGRRLRKELNAVHLQLDGVETVCAFGRDVTGRKRAEAELRHVAGLYALLSQVNHSVVHLKTGPELFEAACRAAVEFGFQMAWVGLLQRDGLVKPVSQAGNVAGYLDGLIIDTRTEALSGGPTGVAVREGRLDVCPDIRIEERMKPWRERALAAGCLASIAVPLRTRGRLVGALSLHSAEEGFFSERECQLMRQIGEDLSFALDVLESAVDRARLAAQLAQARRLESVGKLAGGVAHDFNNLLTVILSGVQHALEEVAADDPVRLSLEDSRDAALRSVALTRQLLTVGRRHPRASSALDLNAAVEGSRSLLDRISGPEVNMVWRPAPSLWPVQADASQVDQLLTNLCANARDAIGTSGTIVFSTANVTLDAASAGALTLAAGDWVTLTVEDDGAGMNPEVQAHLFEPFFTTKPERKGTGLGLAIVYGIVKQGGGDVTVDSTLGEGSTFTLYLPRHQGEHALSQ